MKIKTNLKNKASLDFIDKLLLAQSKGWININNVEQQEIIFLALIAMNKTPIRSTKTKTELIFNYDD